MDAANRVLLRASVDFIKITAQQAYLPLIPCKKEGWVKNLDGYCIGGNATLDHPTPPPPPDIGPPFLARRQWPP